jgi:MFS family permease
VTINYAAWILPALVLIGLGLGLVFGCGLNTATYGADPADAGVASAMVNTCQQVGGSIGTALLNTIAASALSSYLVTHGTSPAAQAQAAVHSYVVAFWVAAGIFAAAAVVCALVLRSGVLTQRRGGDAAPVVA